MTSQQLKPTVNTATAIREWSQAFHARGGGQSELPCTEKTNAMTRRSPISCFHAANEDPLIKCVSDESLQKMLSLE